MPLRAEAPRDLLFGLLALQNAMVTRAQLLAAFGAWNASNCPMADLLVEHGGLTAPRRALLEALLAEHLAAHDNDPEKSLAAFDVNRSTQESLIRAGGTTLEATMAHVGSGSNSGGDEDRTTDFVVGTATQDGLRFRVLRPHARGGLGAVFVAEDSELNREVALKQMLDHHANNPASRQRFLLEAEITGGLEHPGIVPVYGLGQYGDGRPYYAMRFIRGDNLREAIDQFHSDASLRHDSGRRSLELHKLLRRFVDVCNAIEYAHARGVLHRDIKPGNIIVGKHGETLVVDWGLAKPLGRVEPGHDSTERTLVPSSASGTAETLPGLALGTPAYMSPEQAAGDLDRLGAQSDVYSLGATLYSLLTGRAPFDGDDVGEILRRVQMGEFSRPKSLDASLDHALESVCLKAMATRPEDRYPSCRALAEDVECWMADEPVTAWKEPWTRRLARWLTRHRTGVTGAAVAVLAGMLGLVAVLLVQAQANHRLTRMNAELNLANLREADANARLTDANTRIRNQFELATDAIQTFHTGVSENLLLKEKGFESLRKSLLTRAAEFYEKLQSQLKDQDDRHARGIMVHAISELSLLTNDISSARKAVELAQRAVVLQRGLANEPNSDADSILRLVHALRIQGRMQQSAGDYTGALAALEECTRLAESVVRTTPSRDARQYLAYAYDSLSSILADLSRPREALDATLRMCEITRKLADKDPPDVESRHLLASSEFRRGYLLLVFMQQPTEAFEALEQARKIEKKLIDSDPKHRDYRRVLSEIDSMISVVLLDRGEPDRAIDVLEEGRRMIDGLISDEPNVSLFQMLQGGILDNLGIAHFKRGDLHAAIENARGACEIARKLVEKDPDDGQRVRGLGGSLNNLGNLELANGDASSAEATFERSRSLQEPLTRSEPTNDYYAIGLAFSLSGLGRAHIRLGRLREGGAELRDSIEIWHRRNMETTESHYTCAGNHALLAWLAGKDGSGVSASDREVQASRAVAELENPMSAGYRTIRELRSDEDFRALRGRDDYETLLQDLAFPATPFAR